MTTLHGALTGADNMHVPYAWTFADQATREAAVGVDASGIGKLARQLDDNSLWMLTGVGPVTWKAAGGGSSFPSGTRMLFQQSTPPTGWTKDLTKNDYALRVVSDAAGIGGSVGFSVLFGKTATDATTLTVAQMPSHGHDQTVWDAAAGSNMSYMRSVVQRSQYIAGEYVFPNVAAGGNGSHTHALDMRVKYADVVIAQKD